MGRVTRVFTRPVVVGVTLVGLLLVGLGLYWFQPWKLWVDDTVNEDLPTATAPGAGKPEQPETLATGEFISHEHSTSGGVRILRLADGTLVLRLDDLDTSNGPALRVWLTDAPVKPGEDGWHVFDDGRHINAGELKGNKGSQNYTLPAGTDLNRYTSVSIWCDRFDVSFGAAELKRA
ncbi:DM13 domain-containing protein [Streptomyces sp. SAJ15]|uniref:DM13 domain-containing protein n=1 Tax=Streptomyces sp. SAJ15 TaxID=2011095 RepID=UPI001186119A|nr:DM13 domain-containing protein [Streptomyces sp. SAJ15]TVL91556.1 electron transporter [Streptomyces sp. SAJ15]